MAEPALKQAPSVIESRAGRNPSGSNGLSGDSLSLVPNAALNTRTSRNACNEAFLRKQLAAAENLLAMESQLRSLKSRKELNYYAANEFYKTVGAEQIFVHLPARRHPAGKIIAVKGLANPDPNAPHLRWLQSEIDIAMRANFLDRAKPEQADQDDAFFQYRLDSRAAPDGALLTPCVLTLPLIHPRTGRSLGAVSYLTRRTLEQQNVALAKRQCSALASAMSAFSTARIGISTVKIRLLLLLVTLFVAVVLLVPVSLRVLAPVTIQPSSPEIVAAPISGVIESVHVRPNQSVGRGDLLFTFNAVQLQNELDLAVRKVAIAEARYKRAGQDAFLATDGRRELAIAKAELALAKAEKTAAERQLARVDVRADNPGIVLFSGSEDWLGKPVSTGERVMRISDASALRFDIDLAVEDNVILPDVARVNVFLDSDPLNPVSARLTAKSYEAQLSDENRLVFRLKAEPDPEMTDRLRLGLRGTAQIHGNSVPMWYYLFRKPLSYLRQTFGL